MNIKTIRTIKAIAATMMTFNVISEPRLKLKIMLTYVATVIQHSFVVSNFLAASKHTPDVVTF